MTKYLEHLKSWGQSALDRLKHRSWRLWLVVVMILYIGLEIARAALTDASTIFVVWLLRGLKWLTVQPMGLGGLAVLTFIAALAVVSWWQSRPRRPRPDLAVQQLGEHERKLVQDIRTIWNRFGEVAVGRLHDLMRDAINNLDKRVYWAHLLDPVIDDLHRNVEALNGDLASESMLGIDAVRKTFNAMYSDYLKCLRWLATLRAHGDLDAQDRVAERLVWWQDSHFEFWERLRDLHEMPDHNQTLAIFVNCPENQAFTELLKAAQTRHQVQGKTSASTSPGES